MQNMLDQQNELFSQICIWRYIYKSKDDRIDLMNQIVEYVKKNKHQKMHSLDRLITNSYIQQHEYIHIIQQDLGTNSTKIKKRLRRKYDEYFRFNPYFDTLFMDRIMFSQLNREVKMKLLKMILRISAINEIKINQYLEFFIFIPFNEEIEPFFKQKASELLVYYIKNIQKYNYSNNINIFNSLILNMLNLPQYCIPEVYEFLIEQADLDTNNIINFISLRNKDINTILVNRIRKFYDGLHNEKKVIMKFFSQNLVSIQLPRIAIQFQMDFDNLLQIISIYNDYGIQNHVQDLILQCYNTNFDINFDIIQSLCLYMTHEINHRISVLRNENQQLQIQKKLNIEEISQHIKNNKNEQHFEKLSIFDLQSQHEFLKYDYQVQLKLQHLKDIYNTFLYRSQRIKNIQMQKVLFFIVKHIYIDDVLLCCSLQWGADIEIIKFIIQKLKMQIQQEGKILILPEKILSDVHIYDSSQQRGILQIIFENGVTPTLKMITQYPKIIQQNIKYFLQQLSLQELELYHAIYEINNKNKLTIKKKEYVKINEQCNICFDTIPCLILKCSNDCVTHVCEQCIKTSDSDKKCLICRKQKIINFDIEIQQ